MDWPTILKLVMAIITVVLEFLGGGISSQTLVPDQQTTHYLASYDWNCSAPTWTEAPHFSGGVFSGTVSTQCEVNGMARVGLKGLKSHLRDQSLAVATRVHSGPNVKFSGGMIHESFDGSLTVSAEDGQYEIRGTTDIGVSASKLTSKFTANSFSGQGSLSYLRGIEDTVEVQTTSQENHYRVILSYRSQVAKPWYVSGEEFQKAIVEKNEAKITDRRERVLNDLAEHL